jgi:uncharacterized protein RhaS with RHS repeats
MTPLYYYKARIYHPTLGRFLQTDPVGYKADLNIYAYVGNDPYNKTDPTGMEPKDDPCYYSGCSRIVLNDPGRGSDSSSIDDSLSAFTSIDTQGNPQGDNPLAGTSYLMVGGAALAGATAIAGTAAVASLATKEVATAVIPAVANPKLANIVRDLYKGAKTAKPIGTGSTADAIRNELATGLATGGKFHLQKGAEYIRAIDSWLSKNTSASFYDRLVANSIRNDLLNALGK